MLRADFVSNSLENLALEFW